MDDFERKPSIRNREERDNRRGLFDYVWLAVTLPITFNLRLLSSAFRWIRPFSPQLIPLAVGFLLIPILGFLSFCAGFYVWKNVAVGWETALFLQYGDGPMPYAEASLPRLVVQQPYDLSLQLLVPASDSNIALGNFMTALTLSTPSNKTLASIRRPALVTPGSSWSLTSVLGTHGIVRLNIPLLQSYVASTSNVIAHVNLGRNDGWKSLGSGQGRELSVISATLTGSLRHEGIRGLVTHFPLAFGFLASITFFFISFVTVGSLLLPLIEWRLHLDSDGDDTQTKPVRRTRQQFSRSRSEDDKPVRRRLPAPAPSRSRSNRSSRTRSIHDPDAPVTTIRSTEQSVPLRRRRSRLDTFSESE